MNIDLLPPNDFICREGDEFITKTTDNLFGDKRVVIFSLPGAFTPTCSAYQLPDFDQKYEQFKSLGIDEIYCVSVNDGFVMNAWAKDQNIQNVKLIPDGNTYFTRSMGMLVPKFNLGFGERSWRYAVIANDKRIEQWFVEDGIGNNVGNDPYEVTTPDNILLYLTGQS